jgi:hypothetical protein
MHKIEGKGMSNVRPLPMQETSSSGILTQEASGGDGSKINKTQVTQGF